MRNPHDRISVDVARDTIRATVSVLDTQTVPLHDSLGRVLASDITSDIDVAPFDNSSMDGYAVLVSDLMAASGDRPVELEVVGYIGAGSVHLEPLRPGQTVRIMTGAPLPAGCDAVVKYEVVTAVEGSGHEVGDRVSFSAPARPEQNIRRAGEEFKAGDVVLETGTVINPYVMGLLASAGCVDVPVYRKPVVGIFAIGSELVASPVKPTPGMIRDANTACLIGLAEQACCDVRTYGIIPDDSALVKDTLVRALGDCDLVISAGGASQGDFDFILPCIAELGEVIFDYMSLRPGKRQTYGIVEGKPVFGLSGNPAAAAVGFELLIRLALRRMQGFASEDRPQVMAILDHPIRKKEGRRFYQRGVVYQTDGGELHVRECGNQSSALLGGLASCNCLILIEEDMMDVPAGTTVPCIRLDIAEGCAL